VNNILLNEGYMQKQQWVNFEWRIFFAGYL